MTDINLTLPEYLEKNSIKWILNTVESLYKTSTSKNITIEEWNTVIQYLNEAISTGNDLKNALECASEDIKAILGKIIEVEDTMLNDYVTHDSLENELDDVNDALDTKASIEYVDGKLIEKASATDMKAAENQISNINTQLTSKANLTDGKVPVDELPSVTNTSAGIAKFDSAVFTLHGDKVSISDDFLNRFKEVVVVDDIYKLPAIGSSERAYLVNGYLYYWDGSAYGKVKTVESLEMPGISNGSVDDSLVFFKGNAYSRYSLVGGSNNPDALGSLSDYLNGISLKVPQSDAPLAIVYGVGSKVTSTASNAIGINCTVGVKGYYWWSVNGNTLELSTVRKDESDTRIKPDTLDWAEDDYVSIVNVNKYPFVAQITSVDRSNMTITVDYLPKLKKNGIYVPFYDLYNGNFTGATAEDMTIFAITRTGNSDTNNVQHTARNGTVELAWAATAVGVLNLGVGMANLLSGYSNVAYDFGIVGGRENMCGYASVVGGAKNKDRGPYNAIFGHDNNIYPSVSSAFIAGQNNKVRAGNAAAFGYNNEALANAASALMAGDGLKATVWDQAVFGRYNDYTESKDDFLVIGSGTSDSNRKNIFRVDSDGNVRLKGDVYTNGEKLSNDISLKSEVVFSGNYVPSEEPLVISDTKIYSPLYCLVFEYFNKYQIKWVTARPSGYGITVVLDEVRHDALSDWRYTNEIFNMHLNRAADGTITVSFDKLTVSDFGSEGDFSEMPTTFYMGREEYPEVSLKSIFAINPMWKY